MVNWCSRLLVYCPRPLPNSRSFSNRTFLVAGPPTLTRNTPLKSMCTSRMYIFIYWSTGLSWFAKKWLANVFPPSALVQSEKHRLWLAIVWHAPRRGIGLFENPHRFYWWYSAGTRLQNQSCQSHFVESWYNLPMLEQHFKMPSNLLSPWCMTHDLCIDSFFLSKLYP